MTYLQAAEMLEGRNPSAERGRTSTRGRYFEQSVEMDFREVTPTVYRADGRRGRPMWLYLNEARGLICRGNKP